MIDGVIGTIKFLSTLSLRRATCPRLLKPLLFQISIHALLAESDSGTRLQRIATIIFLSTLSLRRATNGRRGRCNDCGISIHALLAESDHPQTSNHPHNTDFYPRSPCGERRWPRGMIPLCLYFYPRSPCGERLLRKVPILGIKYFYPRSPCGERLWPGLLARPFFLISIHALLAESDS